MRVWHGLRHTYYIPFTIDDIDRNSSVSYKLARHDAPCDSTIMQVSDASSSLRRHLPVCTQCRRNRFFAVFICLPFERLLSRRVCSIIAIFCPLRAQHFFASKSQKTAVPGEISEIIGVHEGTGSITTSSSVVLGSTKCA